MTFEERKTEEIKEYLKTRTNSFSLYEFLDITPSVIKIEIIKENFEKIYEKEMTLIPNIINSYNVYIEKDYTCRVQCINDACNNYKKEIEELFQLIQFSHLSEEALLDIYVWAKKRRKELKLPDTLFNIHPDFMPKACILEKANEKINKQKNL